MVFYLQKKALPKRILLAFGIALLLACCLLTVFPPTAFSEAEESLPRQDNLVVTQHTTTIQGNQIDYTVTAGTMAMSTDLGDYDLFFVAYTLNGVEDPADRPITFAYNGGPGAASNISTGISAGLLQNIWRENPTEPFATRACANI